MPFLPLWEGETRKSALVRGSTDKNSERQRRRDGERETEREERARECEEAFVREWVSERENARACACASGSGSERKRERARERKRKMEACVLFLGSLSLITYAVLARY